MDERRSLAKEKLPPEQEALINDLAVDGYHGWSDLYNSTVGQFSMAVEVDGKQVELSAGQAFNKLHTENREERLDLFEKWEKAWTDKEEYCAEALTTWLASVFRFIRLEAGKAYIKNRLRSIGWKRKH